MNYNKVMDFLRKVEGTIKKESPSILTGMAVLGVISTAYFAYKSGPRVEKIIEKYKRDMRECSFLRSPKDKEAKREATSDMAKKLLPAVAPPLIMGGTTIACILGSNSVSNRRMAALSAAYSLSESTVKNLNNKMEEMLGEKKTRAIKDSIMKDKLKMGQRKREEAPLESDFVMTGDGTVLCKDLYSGRYFYSNAEKIMQAITRCSYDVISDMFICLNDFYSAINSPQLPPIPMGNDIGWNVDDTQNGKLPIVLTALLTEDNKPCLCVDYDIFVRNDYRNLH